MNKPKIRFKGFDEEWSEVTLGDVFDYERPDNYIVSSDKYSDDFTTPVLTANKGFILGYTNEKRTYDKPCIIFDDFTLDSKFVDFPFMVKSSALKILSIKDKNKYNLYFAFNRLNSAKIELLGHARHYISVVQPTKILTPSLPEQIKIAEYFGALDSLISLTEKKISSLKQVKQASLQSMFPQEGETTPRIRFKGFEGEWEKCKVSNLFVIKRGYVLPISKTRAIADNEYKYPVYSSQTLRNGLMGYYNQALYKDAITWTTDGANAGTVNFRPGYFYCTNVCGVLTSDRGYANACIAEILGLVAKKYVSFVGNPKLMNNVMAEIQIYIPTSLQEQTQIADYFSNLDKQIALHEARLTKLKSVKASCLDLMFV